MKNLFLIALLMHTYSGAIMQKNDKIYIAGHKGLVGAAVWQELKNQGYENIIGRDSSELDLRNQAAVEKFFESEKPDHVVLAAAQVGGIWANKTRKAEFIYNNLMIEANVIWAAHTNNVKKLLFLGSSCIYPRLCQQPIKEEYLLNGYLEETNDAYAIAKIAGLKLCHDINEQFGKNFISCMPTNLYGPGDNFDLESSHVLPALMSKIYTAKINNEPTVTLWGTGAAMREFLYVEDLAKAIVFLMNHYDQKEHINVGMGSDVTIYQLAHLIKKVVGYEGEFIFDTNKPDGTPKKLLDVSRLTALGWHAETCLVDGIKKTLDWAIKHNVFN